MVKERRPLNPPTCATCRSNDGANGCTHALVRRFDAVDGYRPAWCRTEREDGEHCGPNGLLWEERTPCQRFEWAIPIFPALIIAGLILLAISAFLPD